MPAAARLKTIVAPDDARALLRLLGIDADKVTNVQVAGYKLPDGTMTFDVLFDPK